jgi:hypothetical protein
LPLRDVLAVRLAKEILGPRGGAREQIRGMAGRPPPDPSNEYVVGVLEPKDFKRSSLAHFDRSDFAGDRETSREEDPQNIEEEDAGAVRPPEGITPELDPRALPKSLGISFVVQKGGASKFGFCATWARYRRDGDAWQRTPHKFVIHGVSAERDSEWKSDTDPNVKMSLRSIEVQDGIHVSLFLVNGTPVSNPKKVAEEEMVFQPQLRIVLEDETKLVPVRGHQADGDSGDFGLLYHDRFALARGHLCGATWKAIDPERQLQDRRADEVGPPFSWIDAELLEEPERSLFTAADLRTEYLPSYPIEQAVLTGPPEEGLETISSELLSNAWEPEELSQLLAPFIGAYERWILARRKESESLPERHRKTAKDNLDSCELTLKRIKEGFRLLLSDPEARLAFCFMNRAMYLQSVWKDRGNPLKWYLFQVAFILQCLPGILDPTHPSVLEPGLNDRMVCDLLWFPTGAGKTEAYLGLAAFTMAVRRRRARTSEDLSEEGGTCVVSRYTLRLLTIQQFRRALSMVTACEYLRSISWLPDGFREDGNHWGRTRFSIGLWVGANITPNRLVNWGPYYDRDRRKHVVWPGAVGELFGRERLRRVTALRTKGGGVVIEGDESEPAQVLKCPACGSVLAVSHTTFTSGSHVIHWVVSSDTKPAGTDASQLGNGRTIEVTEAPQIIQKQGTNVYTISVRFRVGPGSTIGPSEIDSWWENHVKPSVAPGCAEEFARASRPGYFLRRSGLAKQPIDFEIRCPNPGCDLSKVTWSEYEPAKEGPVQAQVNPAFALPDKRGESLGMPIPAYTVDDQVYGRCPSMIVSTVDKFARLAFEPRAASIFGHVTRFDSLWGYYRQEAPPETGSLDLEAYTQVKPFGPPTLVIQDELHLIEGPLGSMVGLYEAAIDLLATTGAKTSPILPKYVASTATVRQARSQVQAVFGRKLAQFPPHCLSVDDSFFAISREPHPLESTRPGRLYIGVCAPGRGAQTPIIRIWSVLLQTMQEFRGTRGAADKETDQFWTLVGYFNSKRELGGAVGLFRADIRERIGVIATRDGSTRRDASEYVELSGKTASFDIPGKLDRISRFPGNDVDAVFATAMFGTGVDIDRLGLMVVDGQPKTTANYIQATGRIGRQLGGLVITFLKAARPRDLDHYEFFTGYHRSLHRNVEPITVYPFSPRALERGLGPIAVALLRNAREVQGVNVPREWAEEVRASNGAVRSSGSRLMARRRTSPEVKAIIDYLTARAAMQPQGRNPGSAKFGRLVSSELDRWELFAKQLENELVYVESTFRREASRHVVLGDPGHAPEQQVFRNAPQSLRDVEATATFDDEG